MSGQGCSSSKKRGRNTSGPSLNCRSPPPFIDLDDVIDSAKQKFETGISQQGKSPPPRKSNSAPASPNKPANAASLSVGGRAAKRPNLSSTTSPIRLLIPAPVMTESPEDGRKGAKKANSVSINEVIKLHQDEGVMHLLHGLPASRRRASATQVVSVVRRRPSNEVDRRPLKGLSQSSSDLKRPSPASVREVLALRHTNPDNILTASVADPKRIKPCTQEELMNPASLELLKQLPAKDYVRLWSSPYRYVLSNEDSHVSLKSDLVASQASPSGSVTSMESSVSSAATRNCAIAKNGPEIPARTWKIHTKHYKDILIRTYSSFVQIILSPSTTGLKHSINANVCDELVDALKQLDEDVECRSILFTGLGGIFCQGVDLTVLTNESTEKQRKAAESLASGIKKLIRRLLSSSKVLVAAVNGKAVGLGVTLLPYFDLVYASDKAEFSLEYARLGQIPEAFVSQTPVAKCPEVLLMGHSMTASMAQMAGLVTALVWPSKFLEEIVPRMESLELMPVAGLTSVKRSMKKAFKARVEAVIEEETKELVQNWCSPHFARNARNYLRSSHVAFQ